MSPRAVLVPLVLCLALLVGCGSSDSGTDEETGAATTAAKPQVIVETAESGFDAAKVYREAAPGVVTIRSIFSAPRSCLLRSIHVVVV